ncbi:FMN-dependent NADH-azoreductase [Mycobacterium asiaticum]|uniref:FMN-dependent NADH-azoreductase n=1 Tax=Mycobacterium asiaticum TaxID=1790 RepID=UPI0007F00759|nr:NAD(P)H-dependent oxidoreductase [Mycobacterium asiaticum]OBK95309.1 FMN-dependent NADH-azoreductase [Mycobacterium asiaticum]
MSHLLHIDSSIQGDASVSRRLTAYAAQRWVENHPGGTVTYRDLAADPIPHFDAVSGLARNVPAEQHTPAQAESFALSRRLVEEIKAADTVLLGLPLYNYGAPSIVKSWVDHIVAGGLSFDPATGAGLLGDTEFVVLESQGGGYGPGTPRHGWDHAGNWIVHGVSPTGLVPRIIRAELTMAPVNPAMAGLIPLHEKSFADALAEIDRLWAAADLTA